MDSPAGFIRIVNAVAIGTGSLKVEIDGKDVRAEGYNLGDATGGIGLDVGSHKVVFKRDGVKEGSTTVSLGKDQTVTLIPFAERVPATDEVPVHYDVKVLRLKQKQVDSGRLATFVSVSATPELKVELQGADGKWSSSFVKRLMIGELPLNQSVGYVPVRIGGETVSPIPIGGVGNYVVILYDDAGGKVQPVQFRDFKFLSAD